jgi:hypothetical protein
MDRPSTPPTDKDWKKLQENNSKATIFILGGHVRSIYVKAMHFILQRKFGTNFKMFTKEMPKSKGPIFKLTEVNLNS